MMSMKIRDITMAMGMAARMIGQVLPKALILLWMESEPSAPLTSAWILEEAGMQMVLRMGKVS